MEENTNRASGAVDIYECARPCKCELCVVCGYRKHTAVHGPYLGYPPGSKPWGHEFKPVADAKTIATAVLDVIEGDEK